MKNIKIKVWELVYLTKKQFLIFYAVLAFVVLVLAAASFLLDQSGEISLNSSTHFFSNAGGIIWLIFLLMLVIEGQFYWSRFIKKHLQIIENQNVEILEKNEELQQQKEEILAQNEEIERQKQLAEQRSNEIQKKNKHIMDSIRYAERIQKAVLPKLENLPYKHFVLNKPRDIVGGDFYWFQQQGERLFLAVADSTGHGVPGGFVSMLGISKLNTIVGSKIRQASEVLEVLRDEIKLAFRQTGKDNEQKDGMDIAFCIIDRKNMKLQFAGANNSLYVLRAAQNSAQAAKLIEIKPTRNPIGIYLKEVPFKNNEFDLQRGDMLYLFSDGYADQTGGAKNRKFMYKRLKNSLLQICSYSVQEQAEWLENKFETWKAEQEQVDDVLLFGIRI